MRLAADAGPDGTALFQTSGKVITFTGTCLDPVTGKEMKTRSVLTIQDENKHTFVLFGPGPDGKELQFMTIEYTRTIGK